MESKNQIRISFLIEFFIQSYPFFTYASVKADQNGASATLIY